MASVRVSDTNGCSGLQAFHVIASACKGFLGPDKSVKLITSPEDDGCEMIFSTQRLLSLLDIEHPSGHLLRDACRSHFKQFGTGCTSLVCMTGTWARAIEILLSEGIPAEAIIRYGDEIISLCLDVCEEETIDCTELLQALKVPERKRQLLVENEEYKHHMKINIPFKEKRSKHRMVGLNCNSEQPFKVPNTVDHSIGMFDLSHTNKQIDLDLPQASAKDTSASTHTVDTDDVNDVSWYFDSNDDKLEESPSNSLSDYDDKTLQEDNVISDNFGTSLSTSCSDDVGLESGIHWTAPCEIEENNHTAVDKFSTLQKRDTSSNPNKNSRSMFSEVEWSGSTCSTRVAPMVSRTESLVMACVDGNPHNQDSPVPATPRPGSQLPDRRKLETVDGESCENVNPELPDKSFNLSCTGQKGKTSALNDDRIYKTQSHDSHRNFEFEREPECSQDVACFGEQDVNSLLAGGNQSQSSLVVDDTGLDVTAPIKCDSDSRACRESVTCGSLQRSGEDIDACLENLKISSKTIVSRYPSKKQILRNSRHFQNEDLPELKVSPELVDNCTIYRGSSSKISSTSSKKHLTEIDFHQLNDSGTSELVDAVSSFPKEHARPPLTSSSPKASRTSFESLFDPDADLDSDIERRTRLLSQQLNKVFTSQEVSLETLDEKIERKERTDKALNGFCWTEEDNPDACIFQSSEILHTSHEIQKAHHGIDTETSEHLTKVITSPYPSMVLERKNSFTISSKMVLSDVHCSSAAHYKSIPDFKTLCEGLSHDAGTCMCLARDIFINNLQSGQFEDPYICRVVGPTSDHSAVINGLILPCDIKLMTLASSLRGKPLKAVFVSGDLTKNYRHPGFKGPFEVKVVVKDVKDIPDSPQDIWLKHTVEIIKKFQVSLVLVKGHVDTSLVELCMGSGILIIPSVSYSALEYLSSSTDTAMNSYLRDVSQEDICEGLYLDCWEAGWKATIRCLHTQKTAYVKIWGPCNIQTAVICAASEPQLQSQEEKFCSSYCKLKDVLRTGRVCPGKGATEIKVMRRLEEFQAKITSTSPGNFEDSIKGKVALAFQAGFEEFIIWLVQNSRDITKFDIKSCIYDLVSHGSSDSNFIQEHLFPQSSETAESIWSVLRESCTQSERMVTTNARDPYFDRFSAGFCSCGKDKTVLTSGGISLTDTPSPEDGSEQSSAVSRSVVFDCFSSKIEAWQSAWSLIKLTMNIDSAITTGLNTNELENCNNIVL